MSPDKGMLFEARVARLLANEGAFVRLRVPLEPHFGERFAVTDLDVLAIEFSPTLRSTVTIVECKTTEARGAPSAGDRLLWLTGLRALVSADHSALFVTKAASDPLRRLASELKASIADQRDLVRREQLLGLGPDGRYGSHDPLLLHLSELARATTKPDRELSRAYWFARSDLWLAPPASALKRALGATRLVGERYSDHLPEPERLGLQWLSSELVTGIVVAVVRLAADSYQQPEAIFDVRMAERLAEGLADYRSLEQMSRAVDEYLAGVLSEAGVAPGKLVQSLGAFAPRPPAYADRLLELIHRFAQAPRAAADAPRLADARFGAALLGNSDFDWAAADHEESARLLRLASAFITRQTRLPESLASAMAEPRGSSPPTKLGGHSEAPHESERRPSSPGRASGSVGATHADGSPIDLKAAKSGLGSGDPERPGSDDPTLFGESS